MLLAVPVGRLMGDAIGAALLRGSLDYTLSIEGAVLWLAVVAIISVVSSVLPAHSASRVTVREVLAYE